MDLSVEVRPDQKGAHLSRFSATVEEIIIKYPGGRTMALPNPFFHRGPIRERAYFFGREGEISQALSLLGQTQSIALVGPRRIGKTSLLFHLAHPEILTQPGLNPAEHLFVYLDCGSLGSLDPSAIYRIWLEEISEALADRAGADPASWLGESPQPVTYRFFERALRRLTHQGLKLILILDEFERLSRNPHLEPDFFSGLRALAAKYPLAYVTASQYPLLELTYADASALSSPFFNIFASLRLGLFSKEEAGALLNSLAVKGGLPFHPATLDFLLDLAGPQPLFLQIAGFLAFERQPTGALPLSDQVLAELREQFNLAVAEHFNYSWRNLPPPEQRLLATLPQTHPTRPDLIKRLEQAGLVIRRGQPAYNYLSSAFEAFVRAQPLPGLLQAGPVAIDEGQRQAFGHGQLLNLTATQYSLLVYLLERAGQVITNESLELAVWGESYIEDPERLKAVIKGLRQALGAAASGLENVRGVGYKFSP